MRRDGKTLRVAMPRSSKSFTPRRAPRQPENDLSLSFAGGKKDLTKLPERNEVGSCKRPCLSQVAFGGLFEFKIQTREKRVKADIEHYDLSFPPLPGRKLTESPLALGCMHM